MVGIYKITDKTSGKSYIGQSKDILHRWKAHFESIMSGEGINHNGFNVELENLTFEILELCSCEELDKKEIYWIKYYDTYYNGLNKTLGGQHIKGKDETKKEKKESLAIKGDIYFYNLKEHLMKLKPEPNRGYWCYSPWIEENKNIVNLANKLGFHAIELHSMNNDKYPMDEEQRRVSTIIITTGMVPIEYDFVIVNKAFERGFNIRDSRFNQLIINSINSVEREQAARMVHPYQRALKVKYPEIPEKYLRRWMPLTECRQLAEELAIPAENTNRAKSMTWNSLKEKLNEFGYSYKTDRKKINGKIQVMYYIDGEWLEQESIDNEFMLLVEAHDGE